MGEPILTLSEAKDYLSLSRSVTDDDQKLLALLPAVTRQIETYINNSILEGTFVDRFYGGKKYVYLQKFPITGITSITDTQTVPQTIASDKYIRLDDQGMLRHVGTFPTAKDVNGNTDRWTCTYTAGRFASVEAVTEDWKLAASILLAERYERPEDGVTSRKVGDLSVSYTMADAAQLVPNAVVGLIGSYVSRGV